MIKLSVIEDKVAILADIINAPPRFLPTFGEKYEEARPFVTVDYFYNLIFRDRGEEVKKISTSTLEDLLYEVFKYVASEMSIEYARRNYAKNKDMRRLFFPKQVEILSKINPKWADSRRIELDSILSKTPYEDIIID